jgi:hypothetical protein
MKTILLITMLFLIFSCGQESPPAETSVDLSMTYIVTEGQLVSMGPNMQGVYADTLACVRDNFKGDINNSLPYIVITGGPFLCGSALANGCTDYKTGTVYFTGSLLSLAHEFIHWLTGIGNEGHGTPLFTTCEQINPQRLL